VPREPGGMPSLYLPVRRPDASGLQIVVPKSDVAVESRVFFLDPLAMEQVVLRLLHHRLVQMVPVGDLPRFHDLGRAPFRRSPVERLARADHVVHRVHRLRDRRVGIARWQNTRSM
jgi:hypothetical protein